MPLTQDQQQTIQSWINRHNPNFSCSCCGSHDFSLGEIIAPPTMQNGNINMGGQTVPMIQVICNRCAYVSLFASVLIGIQ